LVDERRLANSRVADHDDLVNRNHSSDRLDNGEIERDMKKWRVSRFFIFVLMTARGIGTSVSLPGKGEKTYTAIRGWITR
jgi:hypothetical protein